MGRRLRANAGTVRTRPASPVRRTLLGHEVVAHLETIPRWLPEALCDSARSAIKNKRQAVYAVLIDGEMALLIVNRREHGHQSAGRVGKESATV